MNVNEQLLALAIQQLPAIIDRLRAAFAHDNPGAPVPTNDDVITAYNDAFAYGVAQDEAYLRAHEG